MKIGIVNDSVIATETLRRIVISDSSLQIVWKAANGAEAIMHCNNIKPDLILMDLIMPVMDGIEATRRIMQSTPCAILIVTASVTANASEVFKAMGAGALDVVATPVVGSSFCDSSGKELLRKIDLIKKLTGATLPNIKSAAVMQPMPQKNDYLVAVGCSTGGPQAILEILSSLPARINTAIVIIQHMDKQFTSGLVSWLNQQKSISLPVKLVTEGERLKNGTVYIPTTDNHLVFDTTGRLKYSPEPEEYFYHPSVDVFFDSAAQYWPGGIIGVLLTGMGRDGARGLLAIKNKGWPTIAQDQQSSVVYGMPKAAAELNAVTEIMPLKEIGPAIYNLLPKSKNI